MSYELLYFKAKWCYPCKRIGPKFEYMLKDSTLNVNRIDIDEKPELADQYNIKYIPTFILLKDKIEKFDDFDELKRRLQELKLI